MCQSLGFAWSAIPPFKLISLSFRWCWLVYVSVLPFQTYFFFLKRFTVPCPAVRDLVMIHLAGRSDFTGYFTLGKFLTLLLLGRSCVFWSCPFSMLSCSWPRKLPPMVFFPFILSLWVCLYCVFSAREHGSLWSFYPFSLIIQYTPSVGLSSPLRANSITCFFAFFHALPVYLALLFLLLGMLAVFPPLPIVVGSCWTPF